MMPKDMNIRLMEMTMTIQHFNMEFNLKKKKLEVLNRTQVKMKAELKKNNTTRKLKGKPYKQNKSSRIQTIKLQGKVEYRDEISEECRNILKHKKGTQRKCGCRNRLGRRIPGPWHGPGLQQYHRGISFKLRKDITIQIQKVHRIPNRQDQERNSTQHTIVKTLKYREQRTYKATREHTQTTYKGKLIRIAAGSSMEAWHSVVPMAVDIQLYFIVVRSSVSRDLLCVLKYDNLFFCPNNLSVVKVEY